MFSINCCYIMSIILQSKTNPAQITSLKLSNYLKDFFFPSYNYKQKKKMIQNGREIVFNSKDGLINQNQAVLHGKKFVRLGDLFQSAQRPLFELDYLYKSSHMDSNAAYRWVVRRLEHFNEQSSLLESQMRDKKQYNNQHPLVNISLMRFLYREMLVIAIMDERELRSNDFASKLKQWYLNLQQRHSFLEGVAIAWKKISKDQEVRLQEMIRFSYSSNVYDELEDYLRKRIIGLQPNAQQKQNIMWWKPKPVLQSEGISLPQIDVLMYRREQRNIRQVREKKIQQEYLDKIAKNKNKIRQYGRNNRFKGKLAIYMQAQVLTENIQLTDHKNRQQPSPAADPLRKIQRSTSHLLDKATKTLGTTCKKPSEFAATSSHQIGRSNLININGIGLIRSKYE